MPVNPNELNGFVLQTFTPYLVVKATGAALVGHVFGGPIPTSLVKSLATALVGHGVLRANTTESTPTPLRGGLYSNLVSTTTTQAWNTEISRDLATNTVTSGGGGGGGGTTAYDDAFSPFNGQTIFNLSHVPTDGTSVEFFINGISYNSALERTVSSSTVTWLGLFTIRTTDQVWIIYH